MAKSRRPKKLSHVPMGWAAVAKGISAAAPFIKPIAKKIYRHPAVQKKWKSIKDKYKLNWLPFGHTSKGKLMGRVNMHKYKKGTRMA